MSLKTDIIKDSDEKVDSDAPTWTGGTAPTGATNHSYRWMQWGRLVFLRINLVYATAGATDSAVSIPLPSDCPVPITPSGFAGASDPLYYGSGLMETTLTGTANASPNDCFLRINSGSNGYDIVVQRISGTGAMVTAFVNIYYFTSV